MRKPLRRRRSGHARLTFAAAGTASAAPTWAPASTAPIHPGVQTDTKAPSAPRTSSSTTRHNVYIGQAAHCAGTDGNTATNGCDAGTLPVGTPVTVDGASKPGTLAYSSWATMQANGETDADTCAVQRHRADQARPGRRGQDQPDRSRSGAARPA